MSRDIKEDVKINRFKLDESADQQTDLYYFWAEKLADARKEKEKKENELELKEAEIELDYRTKKLPIIGIEKITESVIEAVVKTNPAIILLKDQLTELNHNVNKLIAAENSMRQRKDMLEELIKLYFNSYFSNPTVKSSNDQYSQDLRKNLNKNS